MIKFSAASSRDDYQPTCIWPSHPVHRVAVLTSGVAGPDLVAAVTLLTGAEHIVRWVVRNPVVAQATRDGRSSALDELDPWWGWADVVITDPCERSIAECVEHGHVPAVAMPKGGAGSLTARQALHLVHPWWAKGLAVQLSLENPVAGLLAAAAGLRTKPASEGGPMWLGA